YGSGPVGEATVRELVDLARWAPNHKLTNPWRFRVLGAETRRRVEELAGGKEAVKLRRAPTLGLAPAEGSGGAVLAGGDRRATACAVYAILLAATSRGLASYWRTPACFRDPAVREVLGLAPREQVVALVHLGSPVSDPPPKERAPVDEILSVLP